MESDAGEHKVVSDNEVVDRAKVWTMDGDEKEAVRDELGGKG